MTMQAPAGLPFRLGTRTVIEKIASLAFTPGGAMVSTDLAKAGYLQGILLRLRGTYTVVTATPGPKAVFPYDYISRVQLDLPGLNDPYTVSGKMLKLQELAGFPFALGGIPGILAGADTDQQTSTFMKSAGYQAVAADVYPVAVAANTWNLTWWLPAAHNPRDVRGLLPLGNQATATLRVYPGADADLVATPANHSASSLTLDVYQVYMTAPPAGVESPDTTFAVVMDEYEQAVTAVGDNVIDIPKGGIILNVIHQLRNVDTAYPIASDVSTVLDTVSFRVNRDKLWDNVDIAAKLIEQNAGRSFPYPAGSIVYDFDRDQKGIPFMDANGERIPGWLYSDQVNEIKSTLHIATGATLSNAKVTTSVKRLMRV